MTDIVIEVKGGVVQQVVANRRNVRVVLIDWDNYNETPAGQYDPSPYATGKMKHLAPETRRLYRQALKS